jgi:hypothetical protein
MRISFQNCLRCFIAPPPSPKCHPHSAIMIPRGCDIILHEARFDHPALLLCPLPMQSRTPWHCRALGGAWEEDPGHMHTDYRQYWGALIATF